MAETKRVAKHLYKRNYRKANEEVAVNYYAVFVCRLKKKSRWFSLGSDEKTAKDELKVLEARNIRREDFDKDKEPEIKGITFSDWASQYFKYKVDPNKRSVERERRSYKKLEPFFGGLTLREIMKEGFRSRVMEYKAKRLQEPIIRKGKAVEGSKIAFPTVNRELAFLRSLLNLAYDDGIIENAARMKLESEKGRKRDRIASGDEYQALLKDVDRPVQRVLIGLYETSARINELLRLTWDRVDRKAGFIRFRAEDVKEKKPRSTFITPELREILDELETEQKVVNIDRGAGIPNRVFTRAGRPIKSIRTAFENAKEKNNIENLVIHDFRHTCITRWEMAGIPRGAVMAASGHGSIQMHDSYVNVKDHHLVKAFEILTGLRHEKPIDSEKAVSY